MLFLREERTKNKLSYLTWALRLPLIATLRAQVIEQLEVAGPSPFSSFTKCVIT